MSRPGRKATTETSAVVYQLPNLLPSRCAGGGATSINEGVSDDSDQDEEQHRPDPDVCNENDDVVA